MVVTRHLDNTGIPIKVGDIIIDESGNEVKVLSHNYQNRVAIRESDLINGYSCPLSLFLLFCQSVTIKH